MILGRLSVSSLEPPTVHHHHPFFKEKQNEFWKMKVIDNENKKVSWWLDQTTLSSSRSFDHLGDNPVGVVPHLFKKKTHPFQLFIYLLSAIKSPYNMKKKNVFFIFDRHKKFFSFSSSSFSLRRYGTLELTRHLVNAKSSPPKQNKKTREKNENETTHTHTRTTTTHTKKSGKPIRWSPYIHLPFLSQSSFHSLNSKKFYNHKKIKINKIILSQSTFFFVRAPSHRTSTAFLVASCATSNGSTTSCVTSWKRSTVLNDWKLRLHVADHSNTFN